MDARKGVTKGMPVFTRDGEKLGKVVAADDTGLFVEKGFFFPKEYGLRYEDVEDVGDDGVRLRLDRAELTRALAGNDRGLERSRPSAVSAERDRTGTPAESLATPTTRAAQSEPSTRRGEGLTIPMVGEGIVPMLVEEEVVVVREVPPAGGGVRAAPEEHPAGAGSGGNRPEPKPDDTSSPDRREPHRHG
jgi:hypothetical protein